MGSRLQSCPEPYPLAFGLPSIEPHVSVPRGLAWQYVLSWYLAGIAHLHWTYDQFDHAGCLYHHIPGHKAKAFQCILLYTSADDHSRRRHLSARQHDVLLHSTWIGDVDTRLGHAHL